MLRERAEHDTDSGEMNPFVQLKLFGRGMASARTRFCRVAIRVRCRVQKPAQRAEQGCSSLLRDIIELARTGTGFI